MFWRFLPSDDKKVQRFISRDCDSRLNARDRFAVEEWIGSVRACHCLRDHPNHFLPIQGGMWGCDNRFSKKSNTTMIGLIEKFLLSEEKCKSDNGWGCDQTFLNSVIWPLIEMDQIGHNSFFCTRRTNSFGFPTPRDSNHQFVGQVFNDDDTPIQQDIEKIRTATTVQECKSTNKQDFLPPFYNEIGTSQHQPIEHEQNFTLTMPQWLHSNSNVTIVMKRARVDRMGEQTRAFILLSAFADCHGYNFCLGYSSGQKYAFEFSIPICPPDFPSEGTIQYIN